MLLFLTIKKDYVAHVEDILNLKGLHNPISGSNVTAILLEGEFVLLVELHQEVSAPAAYAAGLFFEVLLNLFESCT